MFRLNLMLLGALVLCALSLVTSRHQARNLFVELERETARTRAFETEFGQLQLEQSTWAMPVRVEKIARENLKMQIPGPRRIEVVPGEAPEMTGASRRRSVPRPRRSCHGSARRSYSASCCSSSSCSSGRSLLSPVDRQRVPAGAGELALQPRDRIARASRPHRRSRRANCSRSRLR